ncbi:helix-turn-helix domain-containing protein [Streptomyces sp. NPDC049577]|uniref:helix-turn-helix domain-containing protein n=1 Tax=Streptomyces sp. NPDC049577 TaxID=3155153 RepID=UPI003446FD15
MSRWKELPASLDQRVRQLVVQLRRLKDHSGLSLASLAAKTSYSSSSWERYLNGKQLPPRDAVEQLARVCGTEPTRLLVLQELAAEAWSDEAAAPGGTGVEAGGEAAGETAGEAAGDGPDDRPEGPAEEPRQRKRRLRVLVAAAAVLVVALAAGLLIGRPWQDDDTKGATATAAAQPSQSPFVFVQGRNRPCRVERRDGGLRAGYSTTRSVLMDLKSSGWEVLEAQCLLKYHGYDPGIADGSYGPRSKAAASAFQKDHRLVVDGIIGPDTWGELRK